MSRLLGAVLAGGESRRFGSDKAVALLDGQSLIDRVVDGLTIQVDEVIVCGRSTGSMTCVPDRPASRLGPLGGLNAALHYAAAHGFCAVLSVPCDTPDLPDDLAIRLAATGNSSYLLNLPVIGMWPSSLAVLLDRHLASTSDRSVRFWAKLAGAQAIDIGELPNVNTPGDLRRLELRDG